MPANIFNFRCDILTLQKGCRRKEKWIWKEVHKPLKERLHNAASNGELNKTGLLLINLKQKGPV